MPRIYPWSKWFSKKKFRVLQGKDFWCSTPSMCQQIRNRAILQEKSVSIDVQGGEIIVKVREKDEQ